MVTITYTGLDRAGVAHTGRVEVLSVHAFVRRRFLAGWRSLSVYRPAAKDPANCVGAIVRNDSGRRVLWVDSS